MQHKFQLYRRIIIDGFAMWIAEIFNLGNVNVNTFPSTAPYSKTQNSFD